MNTFPITIHAVAPAKVNLFLKLVGKRQDNYHLLESFFVPVEQLHDKLTVTLDNNGSEVSISSDHPQMSDADSNLCTKAAGLYFETAGISPSCHIHLEKNIPIGAGLGGGSSDCAAVLKVLNSFYGKFDEQQLAGLALSLGADVPFFLVNKISYVSGIGENITPLDCPFSGKLMILSPPFSIATSWAFKHIDPSIIGADPSDSSSKIQKALMNDDILTAARFLRNDFESLVFEKFPAYEVWKKYLLSCGALHVGLSGSGSSFFAFFENDEKMLSARERFAQSYGNFVKIYG